MIKNIIILTLLVVIGFGYAQAKKYCEPAFFESFPFIKKDQMVKVEQGLEQAKVKASDGLSKAATLLGTSTASTTN